MISLLQSLRFIFAIMIFLHHYPVDGTGCFKAVVLVVYYYEIPVSKYLKRKIVCVK